MEIYCQLDRQVHSDQRIYAGTMNKRDWFTANQCTVVQWRALQTPFVYSIQIRLITALSKAVETLRNPMKNDQVRRIRKQN